MVPRSRSAGTLITVLALLSAIFFSSVSADERCALTFTGCPEEFDGDTILVPDNVTKLYSLVHACKASQVIHVGGTGGTSSILFVIDNTGSMKGTNGNDPTGARFKVVKDLLDTIMEKQPNAEVGLIVFREHLFFDTTTTQYYTQYFKALHPVLDGEPDQAYLPFMGLSKTYNGKTGIEIIKDILTTDSTGGDLLYQPLYRNVRPNTGGETNINGAFIAAKQALLSAQNQKDHQFMIFLSDGEPSGSAQAGLNQNWFSTAVGVDSIATTFTVYFNKAGTQPALLTTMTTNIQNNGYSTANPESNIWSLASVSYATLMSLLMNNVISNILVSGNPTKMTLNGKTSSIYLDSSFFYADSFPVTETPTHITMEISYRYVNPSTQVLTDTVIKTGFYIQRSAQVTTLPAHLGEVCQTYTGPAANIPVRAVLKDGNHNGRLDTIDIVWTVDSNITGNPTVTQLVQTLVITTLDGKKDTLHAASLQYDRAHKTIHVVLTEDTSKGFETGWTGSTITLSNYKMTSSGSIFVVDSVVDSAAPVIKSVCFQPMSNADSLRVEFSEPLSGTYPPVCGDTVLWDSTGVPRKEVLCSAGVAAVAPQGSMVSYGFPKGTLSSSGSLIVEGDRPAFRLETCSGVEIVKSYITVGNPLNPHTSVVPPGLRNPNNQSYPYGSRIEITLNPALSGHLGKITGKLTILDAVGNVVRDTMMFSDSASADKKLFWVWDGKTKSGAWAAPGTYLARILVRDNVKGTKQVIRMNVGIKR
jgi:hypothetical protein